MLIDIAARRVSRQTRLCIHERNKLRQEREEANQINVTTTITAGEPTDPLYRSKNCPQCKAEEKAANKYRWKLILCLILPYALQALDVTMYEISLSPLH